MPDDDPPAADPKPRSTVVSPFRAVLPRAVSVVPAMGPAIFAHTAQIWQDLPPVALSSAPLAANGLFVQASDQPAAAAIDTLRTRLLGEIAQHRWRRIAVTSPSPGCGASFVAINLALSLARMPSSRTALVDLDLRHPTVASALGLNEPCQMADFLSGAVPLEAVFRRHGTTLALGLNARAAERDIDPLHDPHALIALADIVELLDPGVILYDLPPVLSGDDVLAMAASVDAVLLVTDGTKTTPAEVLAAEKSLEGRIPVLGIVLNRTQEFHAGRSRENRK